MSALQVKHEFKGRVRRWAEALDVEVTALSVRPMRRKWASCSTTGSLSFSAELLALEPELVDYVIVHELLHLRVPNHGRLWKSLMCAHLGDYAVLHGRLQSLAGERLLARSAQ
jgi:predicted metal-dependent hydrolase